ncbi:MAG: hypothetical protein AB9834_10825 [Lentimicrobium sp.]
MRIPFREARLKPIIVGSLKYSEFITNLLPIAAGATGNSRYCYGVWMRHLSYLAKYNGGVMPAKITEIGPGDSIGVGLAALLSGVERYFALEVIKYWNIERNLRIFDELIALFKKREVIPGNDEFPLLQPIMENNSFPSLIITDDLLVQTMDKKRIQHIREELMDPDNADNFMIRYKVPWYDKAIIEPSSQDFIFSHVVIQHIDDIENTFSTMNYWLKPGGYVSHLIDYKSLGFTTRWNGHWTFTDWEWCRMVGGRKFSQNRLPHSSYIQLFKEYNFNILFLKIFNKQNKLTRNQLAKKYRSLSEDDLNTSDAYILAQKASSVN